MSALEVLTTTRSVRKRLDLEQPVPLSDIRGAVEIALQAPSGGNLQGWKWIAVEDSKVKTQLAELYRRFYSTYREHLVAEQSADSIAVAQTLEGGDRLAANLHDVPWLVVPCITGPMGRSDTGMAAFGQAMTWASIYPAVWSFQLALRARGLASCITTNHLAFEREAAEILNVPYETTNQAALIPVARSIGSGFRQATRRPPEEVLAIDCW
ncbi:MAG: nitroreductase [Deltaproteobacteria bacterium]|jgi:nitroreductase|nr:nitroreductase [Deltaproteobacteria bacterium]